MAEKMSYGKNYCLNSLRQKLLPREGLGIFQSKSLVSIQIDLT